MSARDALPDRPLNQRKARDRALILPFVGLILLVPPFASIFQLDARVAGVPFTALYLFAVWALLIIGAALLAPRLRDDDESGAGTSPGNDPPG